MISSISLKEFKSFRELCNLNIKPLTILCGANSSGKSSILKSLLILKQSYENTSANDALTLNGAYSNNGYFGDIIHCHKESSFSISNTFKITDPFNGKSYVENQTETLQSYKALKKIFAKRGQTVNVFEISSNIEFYENKSSSLIKMAVIKSYEIQISATINGEVKKSGITLERNGNSERKFNIKWTPSRMLVFIL